MELKKIILAVALSVALLALVLGLSLGLTLPRDSNSLKTKFMERCEKFKDYNCGDIWEVFRQAFVNKDPCKVPMEAYDPLIAAVPFKLECDRTLLWSKTIDVVHNFSQKNKGCCITLEDTQLGSMLDGLTWCGKKGSSEIFTSGCPAWEFCEDNPVRSFWNRASAAFADIACGEVTAMLNGAINTPFNLTSVFARIEVKRLKAPRVQSLKVVLVTQKHAVSTCTDASLNNLQNTLDKGIRYNCIEVPQSQIDACSSDPEAPCGACW